MSGFLDVQAGVHESDLHIKAVISLPNQNTAEDVFCLWYFNSTTTAGQEPSKLKSLALNEPLVKLNDRRAIQLPGLGEQGDVIRDCLRDDAGLKGVAVKLGRWPNQFSHLSPVLSPSWPE